MRKYIDIQEASEILELAPNALRRWIDQNVLIPEICEPKPMLFLRKDVLRLKKQYDACNRDYRKLKREYIYA